MEIIKVLKEKVPSPGTKNHELKYNDIYLIDNDGEKEIHILMNNKNVIGVIPYNGDENLINELKTVTWTVEPNGTTIKSNSYSLESNKDIRLHKLLKKYNLNYYVQDKVSYEGENK